MAENNVQNQVKGFFSKLGLAQKIILIAAPILVVGGLLYLMSSINTTEKSVLYSGLAEQDAGKIIESLKTNQIQYEIKDNGSTIMVDKDLVAETRLSLASQGLPESSVVGYELFDKTNLGMSEFVQKLNYKRALEGELSKTISALDEVKKARVHIVMPEKALFEKDQKQPTASITLQLKSGRNLNQNTVEGIQTLVAASIEGMSTNNVSIIDHKGKLLSVPDMSSNSTAGLTAQQYEQQRNVEEYLMNKAQSMLDNVLGVGNSSVRLNAELDFTKIEQTKTDFDPDKQIARSEQTIVENNRSVDTSGFSATNNERSQSNSIINYEIAQNVEVISHSVGNIKRLSVAAILNNVPKVVDSSGQRTVTYQPRPDEEIQKLTDLIKNAVGYNPDRNDQITVTNVMFDTNIEDFETEMVQPLEWYQEPYNQRLFMLLAIIAITVFLMYRFMQSKFMKERVRIALELPGKAELSVDLETETQQQQMVDELSFDDNLMLLPSELPEQLLLSGEGGSFESGDNLLLESGNYPQRGTSKMKSFININSQLDEETLMKIELRNKVQEYVDKNAEDAARLVKMFINQDPDERKNKQ